MKKVTICVLAFLTGGISGGTAACLYFRKKYRDLANMEIESVKDEFRKKYCQKEPEKPETPDQNEIPEEKTPEAKTEARKEYEAQVQANKYAESAKTYEILTPQQFEESEYPCKTINHYVDGVLCFHGSMDKLSRQDIQLYIGADALNKIGKFNGDEMYVRNHRFKTDYEILRQDVSYKEVLARGNP